ncbi:MAG: exosortase H-associated membrane protein [Prosthecobacter sp.]|jgi:hypothetical protein|nr:exosortase H-associated membrane protein [Prosthecobacter sp.]
MFGPLKSLLFLAVLWLPLSFFVWFYFAQVFVIPIASLAFAVLHNLMPGTFEAIEQSGRLLTLVTTLPVMIDGRAGVALVEVNPMIYGYCIPVLAGLVMATPLRGWQRAWQLALGTLVLMLVQTFGTVFDVLKNVALRSGEVGASAVAEAGISVDAIAFCYQFGYLVLPAIMPVILWVAFNQAFIRSLVTIEGSELPEIGTSGRDTKS